MHLFDPTAIARAAEEAAHVATDPSIVGRFGLDWKLFLAQLVNFGIVLLVLWKWVFTPVAKVLERRTKRIEDSLKNAELIDAQKKEFEHWKDKEIVDARKQAGEIISQAKSDAEKVKEDVLAKAKDEQLKLIDDGKKQLVQENAQMVEAAKNHLAELVVLATEKILREKLDEKQDARFVREAIKVIHN